MSNRLKNKALKSKKSLKESRSLEPLLYFGSLLANCMLFFAIIVIGLNQNVVASLMDDGVPAELKFVVLIVAAITVGAFIIEKRNDRLVKISFMLIADILTIATAFFPPVY